MPVIRVEKTKNYTVMSNYHLQDKRLSLKAKGLLSIILSLPEQWDYSIAGLAAVCKEGINCIRTTIIELEQNGYITRSRIRQENGQLGGAEYVVTEAPVIATEAHETDEPEREKPVYENHMQGSHMYGNSRELNTYLIKDLSNQYTNSLEDDRKTGNAVNGRPVVVAEGDGFDCVLQAYREKISRSIPATCKDRLLYYAEQMGKDCCIRAFDVATDAGKPHWSYIKGILDKKLAQGVHSLADWDTVESNRTRSSSRPASVKRDHDLQPSLDSIQKNADWLDAFLAEQDAGHEIPV